MPGGRSPPLPPSMGLRHSPAPCQFPFFTPNPSLRAKRAPSTPPGGGRPPASPQLTVVAVPHAVLENRPPLLLLLARHHAEVVVPGVGVPEDQGEIRGALDDGGVPRLGRHACGGKDALKGQRGWLPPGPLPLCAPGISEGQSTLMEAAGLQASAGLRGVRKANANKPGACFLPGRCQGSSSNRQGQAQPLGTGLRAAEPPQTGALAG